MKTKAPYKVKSSYKVKVLDSAGKFDATLSEYRKALAVLIEIIEQEWDAISAVETPKKRRSFVERLMHQTKMNPFPKYDRFNIDHYKCPSYMRRAIIAEAIGIVSSYKSNYANWEIHKQGNPPKLRYDHYAFPAMYNTVMFLKTGEYTARLKVRDGKDWAWLDVKLRKSDVDYINRHRPDSEVSAPILMKSGKRWYLRFAFKTEVELTERNDIITAVDLGINNAAVCCAMCSDGTVTGREFISFPAEKDLLGTKLNRIKKAQQHGARGTPRLWNFANNINRAITEKTAAAIIAFARKHNSDIIVFEYLDMNGRVYGSKRQRLHLWRKRGVQEILMSGAHHLGMRYSRVSARNTSKLAFDGSGWVKRDEDNYSLCTFKSGKRYNTDLNAAYNIGARYFIRDILKSLPETERLALEAKVPPLARRTTCTLSDLLKLNAVLAA